MTTPTSRWTLSPDWRRPDDTVLRERLTTIQFKVTRHDGTEPPFRNLYHDEKRDGISVDIVSGEPLFSSRDKFDSGTGWPSFSCPLEPAHLVERIDRSWVSTRIEECRHGMLEAGQDLGGHACSIARGAVGDAGPGERRCGDVRIAGVGEPGPRHNAPRV
jgi:methionine-R-sulfoxide reductase